MKCNICEADFLAADMIKSQYACKDCWRGYQRQRRYGITPERFHQLLIEQQHVCAVCQLPDALGKELAVDHDHETGKVRGLLCGKCNRGIGYLMDDISILKSAINYLEGTKNE